MNFLIKGSRIPFNYLTISLVCFFELLSMYNKSFWIFRYVFLKAYSNTLKKDLRIYLNLLLFGTPKFLSQIRSIRYLLNLFNY